MTEKRNRKAPRTFDEEARARALETLRRTGNASAAYREAGVGRTTYYKRIENDPEFRAAVEDAKEEAFDNLEEIVRCRAVDGWTVVRRKRQRVVDAWGCVDWVVVEELVEHRFDNKLLLRLLEACRPYRWRRHSQIEVEPGDRATTLAALLMAAAAEEAEEGRDMSFPYGPGVEGTA